MSIAGHQRRDGGTELTDRFAAIADPTRRGIVELLAQGERSAGEIVKRFSVSAPAISQHLKVLREAGLVATRVDGQRRVHSLKRDGLDEIGGWLRRTQAFWSDRLDVLEAELNEENRESIAELGHRESAENAETEN